MPKSNKKDVSPKSREKRKRRRYAAPDFRAEGRLSEVAAAFKP